MEPREWPEDQNAAAWSSHWQREPAAGRPPAQAHHVAVRRHERGACHQQQPGDPRLRHCRRRALVAAPLPVFCEQGDVDVIALDVSSRLPFQLRKPLVDAAIARGVYFELKYTAALGDSSGRRYFFANASSLVRITRGRHIIFGSGAARDMLLRSPYDVINIGMLLGLPYGKAMDAVSSSCTAVIAHGEVRKVKGSQVVVMRDATEGDDDVDMMTE
ncbi:hypothetical protein SPRG_01400 [Saprolegnia parasitica CBS 223.65]|uniref:Uncharacterized protein n=1 Tax=Saprolegnia parasitica (strain CBS 223.65) TaxID=695850 RepID=A0A067CY04_SAPPC|nr:hypothetical protein SPRG_01400 [Saprolegnia parasitica CBS 223.65]KDO34130.1 hypothetical protein SPRG_01400 [Saprolegnia parasitica CBS 223.65]|eukprot:XP_012195007.1 hypothetical protein SPRG_01400 [Saprolegnia parasitica CBS 223.65]